MNMRNIRSLLEYVLSCVYIQTYEHIDYLIMQQVNNIKNNKEDMKFMNKK